jgi:hypothetical protein
VSNVIMQTLRDTGHDVLRLQDQLPIESPDPVVIAKAQELDALLLSLERRFCGYCQLSPGKLPRDHCPSSAEPSRNYSTTHGKVMRLLLIAF